MFTTGAQPKVAKLYVINLVAVDEEGGKHLFLCTTVAYSEQEAVMKGLENMRRSNFQLWDLGVKCGGFEMLCSQVLTQELVQKMFDKVVFNTPQLDIKVAVEPQDEARKEKNRLIKQIIETRDNRLLEANRGLLNDYEMAYIKDNIR